MSKCKSIKKGSVCLTANMLILVGALCLNPTYDKKSIKSSLLNIHQKTTYQEIEEELPNENIENLLTDNQNEENEIQEIVEVKKVFKDDILRNKILETLNLTDESELTQDIIESVTEFDFTDSGITSLEGIEIFTNLKKIRAYGNEITDLSPLKDLTSMEILVLENNCISDLSPLENLKKLRVLNIAGNRVRDISIIKNFEFLDSLAYDTNPITDYMPIYEKIETMADLFYEIIGEPNSIYKSKWIDNQTEMLLKNQAVLDDMKSWVESNITDEMSDSEKEYRIINFITNRFTYNYENKSYIDLYKIYNENYVVCYGYAIIFDYLATYAGLDTYTIKAWTSNNDLGHIWNAVKIDGVYYQLDLTYYDSYLEQNNPDCYKYINISNDTMIKLHDNLFIPASSELTYENNQDMIATENTRTR